MVTRNDIIPLYLLETPKALVWVHLYLSLVKVQFLTLHFAQFSPTTVLRAF